MSPVAELLNGPITLEYAEVLSAATRKRDNPQTCGSDCSDGRQCQDETCPAKEQGKYKRKPATKPKRKAFYPVVPGWNEPPAARV